MKKKKEENKKDEEKKKKQMTRKTKKTYPVLSILVEKDCVWISLSLSLHRLIGLVVRTSASRAEDPGFESRLCEDFFRPSHISDSKIGTPVATLPGA